MTSLSYNRMTAVLTTGVFLIVSVLLAGLSGQRSADPLLRRPSTFFTDPSGARALLLIIQQLLPEAAQWRRPLNLLPPPDTASAPSTLIVAGPAKPLSTSEAEHLGRWLNTGGQLILLSANGWPFEAIRNGCQAGRAYPVSSPRLCLLSANRQLRAVHFRRSESPSHGLAIRRT